MTFPDPDTILPHRGRWKLVDRIEEHGEDYVVTSFHFDEAFVEGHFPDHPLVPGVALTEGLAQTMLCLGADREAPPEGIPALIGLDRVRFRAPVVPPARVTFRVQVKSRHGRVTICRGTATLDGKRVCTATLMGTVLDDRE